MSKKLTKSRRTRSVSYKLYWCWTEDNEEDWFIVARTISEAKKFHEYLEGYDTGDAKAKLVFVFKELPKELQFVGWPNEEHLRLSGAVVLKATPPRVVEIKGITYTEGLLDSMVCGFADDEFDALGGGRPNNTARRYNA